jgi:hypothetical protein
MAFDRCWFDARSRPGETVRPAAAAIPDLHRDWQAATLLALLIPGVEHRSYQRSDGVRLTWLLHPDDSWSRAEEGGEPAALVHQASRLRLWDEFETARAAWERRGHLLWTSCAPNCAPTGQARCFGQDSRPALAAVTTTPISDRQMS